MEIKKLKIAAVAAVASCLALGGATASLALGEDAKIASAAIDTSDTKTYGMVRLWVATQVKGNNINESMGQSKLRINGQDGTPLETFSMHYVWNAAEAINNEQGRDFYWADIPYEKYEGCTVTVQRFDSTGNSLWNTSQNTHSLSECIGKLILFNKWREGDSTGTSEVVTPSWKISSEIAALSLEGLNTCSASAVNGFNAINLIGQSFIYDDFSTRTGEKTDMEELRNRDIKDYDGSDSGNWDGGWRNGEKTAMIKAGEKLDALLSLYDQSRGA